jgi:hypothetical protein
LILISGVVSTVKAGFVSAMATQLVILLFLRFSLGIGLGGL